LDTTYAQLHEAHKNRLTEGKGELTIQVLRNHVSVLNSYLVFCGKTAENKIGRELTHDFIKKSAAFVELVCDGKKKAAADRMSILRSWYKTVEKFTQASRLQTHSGVSQFHQELRIAVAKKGTSVVEIARAVKCEPNSLRKWLAGAYPFKTSLPSFHRLETYLGFERGYLESLLNFPRYKGTIANHSGNDQYIERFQESMKSRYFLPCEELSFELKAEWQKLLRYKTAEFPVGLRRSATGWWRTISAEDATRKTIKNPMCHIENGKVCPSAERAESSLRSFLGFLVKPASDEKFPGLGLPIDGVQTLAMFVIPEFVSAYFEFMKARSGNIAHSGHVAFGGYVGSLTRETEGYLAQQPAFLKKIEAYASDRTWEALCRETHELCLAWQLAGKNKKSRDPKAPLMALLALDQPLKPFARAINKLDEAAAACSPGSSYQAAYKRDALLLALSIANPLRLRTLTIAKYVPPGKASAYKTNLYKTEKGVWRLRFSRDEFKNGEGKAENYDAPLPRGLSERIDEYLDEYWPTLMKRNPSGPWIFASKRGQKHSALDNVISNIAKNYIPEVTRLRGHALRHIVATDFLRRNPGQYSVIAELLHDTLETVLKNYVHGKMESAFNAHEESLKNFLSGI
jgi:site-specific recombinase XerD